MLDRQEREIARLAALDRYRILDTDPESEFDELTELAAHICRTPMSLVSLVDAHRQWFKSRRGIDVCSTDREIAFCRYAVESGELLVVPEARADARFANNPLVTGPPYIRSYAGAPLITPEGYVLGTLCVLDTKPRDFDAQQLRLLTMLAKKATMQLEHRRQTYALTIEIAEHQAAEAQLAHKKLFDETVLESVNAGVLACDAAGRVVVRNAAQRRLTGLDDCELTETDQVYAGSGRLRLLGADRQELSGNESPLRQALAGETLVNVPMQIGRIDGPLYDVLVTARKIEDPDGMLLGAVAAFTDITAERDVQAQLRASASFHDAVLAASPDVIFVVDPKTNSTVWSSKKLPELLGYSTQEIHNLGSTIVQSLVHPDDVEALLAANVAATELADGEVLALRYRALHAAGDYRWLSRRVTPFTRDDDGCVIQLLGIARDIGDVVQIEERLFEAALHDPLTGLPNRTLLADRLHGALARSGRSGTELTVLYVDLDGFKRVNDTGGHAAGDAVLIATAERLRGALRSADTVARVGGDEFVIVVEPGLRRHGSIGPATTRIDIRAEALEVVRRINRQVAAPILVDGVSYTVTASIGVAFAEPDSAADDVLRAADLAMYQAKSRGKDCYEVFAGARATA